MAQKIILEIDKDTKPLDLDMLVYSSDKEKYVPKSKTNILAKVTKRFVADEKTVSDLTLEVESLKSDLAKLTKIVKEIIEND